MVIPEADLKAFLAWAQGFEQRLPNTDKEERAEFRARVMVLVSSGFPADKPPFDVEAAAEGKVAGVVSPATLLKAVRYYMTVGKDPGKAMLASEMAWKLIGEMQKIALN